MTEFSASPEIARKHRQRLDNSLFAPPRKQMSSIKVDARTEKARPRRLFHLAITAGAALLFLGAATQAFAQVEGSVRPKPLPPLSNPGSPRLAAKELFARSLTPTSGPAKVIGFYAKGCLSGARRLPL
ncbi:MAG TPA: hypothetical protein VMU56_09275, partial [Beijerinckiaceae bacterium]|nr:hypothetical protein [Beijerinckiaceae bacterium]